MWEPPGTGCLLERVEEEPGLVLVGVGRRRGAVETRGRSGGPQGTRKHALCREWSREMASETGVLCA